MAAAEAAAQAERAADAALAAWGSPPAAEALRGALESAEAAARGALATKTVDGSLGVLAASAAAASARAEIALVAVAKRNNARMLEANHHVRTAEEGCDGLAPRPRPVRQRQMRV